MCCAFRTFLFSLLRYFSSVRSGDIRPEGPEEHLPSDLDTVETDLLPGLFPSIHRLTFPVRFVDVTVPVGV